MALNFQNKKPASVQRVLLVVFLVLSIACLTVYSREGASGPLHAVQNAVAGAVAPLKVVGAAAGSAVESARDAVDDATASEDTLTALRDRNAELTELVTQAEEYRQEAERLESLLGLADTYQIDGIGARVIGRSTDAWNQTVTIDAGSDAGVEAGLTVMGPSGVIGQVVSTSAGSSTVRPRPRSRSPMRPRPSSRADSAAATRAGCSSAPSCASTAAPTTARAA